MIEQVCNEVRNFFVQPSVDIHATYYTIENGSIEPLSFIAQGQYYRICGSVFNDGVYCHGVDDTELQDEEFFGSVWAMRVPKAFIALCNEIEAWNETNAAVLNSPLQSESFANYSYTKSSGSGNNAAITWQSHFANKLNAFRRLSVL